MSKNMLKINNHGTFRAQLVELGAGPVPDFVDDEPAEPAMVDGEPLVSVHYNVPLKDARELGGTLYQWVELHVTSAELGEGEEEAEPFVVWATDRHGWWRAHAGGYTPNALEAGVFTSTKGLNLTAKDECVPVSAFLQRFASSSDEAPSTLGAWMKQRMMGIP
jgi:hypothetical protein